MHKKMNDNNDEEFEENEIFLYLDFNGSLSASTFKRDELFFKMVNLDTDSPFVQLDDVVYKGCYSDAIGTNLFFEEREDENMETLSAPTPINLKYLLKQTKILDLKRIQLPESIHPVNENDHFKVRFDCEYTEILNKLANSSFRIDDFIHEENEKSDEESVTKIEPKLDEKCKEKPAKKKKLTHKNIDKKLECQPSTSTEEPMEVQQIEPIIENEVVHSSKLDILKNLAHRPLLTLQENKNNNSLSKVKDFKSYLQPFATVDLVLENINLEDLIFQWNLENMGKIIGKPFQINNFENLDLIGKLYVVIRYLKEQENDLQKKTTHELSKVDLYGYTLSQKHELLKFFALRFVQLISKKIKSIRQKNFPS